MCAAPRVSAQYSNPPREVGKPKPNIAPRSIVPGSQPVRRRIRVASSKMGSVSRAVLGTVRKLREEGMKVGLLRPITLWPYPYERVRQLAEGKRAVVVFEMNWGQMVEDVALAMQMNDAPLHFVPRHGGLTFNPNDVEEPLRAIAADPLRSDSLWRVK